MKLEGDREHNIHEFFVNREYVRVRMKLARARKPHENSESLFTWDESFLDYIMIKNY